MGRTPGQGILDNPGRQVGFGKGVIDPLAGDRVGDPGGIAEHQAPVVGKPS